MVKLTLSVLQLTSSYCLCVALVITFLFHFVNKNKKFDLIVGNNKN